MCASVTDAFVPGLLFAESCVDIMEPGAKVLSLFTLTVLESGGHTFILILVK